MATKHITQNVIRSLKPPTQGNTVIWDDEVVGFGVRITAGGSIAFVLRYVVNGRERRFTIGKHPDLSPTAAREEAIRRRGDISRGIDPLANREADRSAPTMADLCERYIERHAIPHKRPSSVADDRSIINRVIKPTFGNRKVVDVTHDDIDLVHQSMRATPYQANRTVALLSKMFSLSVFKWKMRTDNPCRGVQQFQEHKRKRYLKPDELQRLVRALAQHRNQQTANAVRLLLLTGARKGELLSANWGQFDLDRGEWVKPSAHTKQRLEHHVPLSAPALALLVAMKANHDKRSEPTTFLFPSYVGDTPQQELKRFWHSICKTAGISNVRVHDLRHSFASYLASSGASLPLIGEMLGHTQASTTARYAHLLDDPKRKAAKRVGAIIAAAETGKSAEIMSLPKRRGARHHGKTA